MAKKPAQTLKLRVLFLIGAAAVIVFLTIAPAREYFRQRAEIKKLSAELSDVKDENKGLREETQRLNTDAYIEQQARERLGLIKPGEEPFLLVPPKQEQPKPETKPPAKPKKKAKPEPWWQQIWDYMKSWF